MSDQPEKKFARGGEASRLGVVRFSAAQFLGALALFMVVAPMVEELPNGRFITGALLTLVLATGVLAVGRRRKTLILAAILVAPAIVSRWLNHFWPDLVGRELFLVTGLVFVAFVVAHLFHFILRAPRVNSEVLCAGISGYLLLGFLWAFAYLLAGRIVPDSFTVINAGGLTVRSIGDVEAFYFSFITLSTVGYGDITPAANGVRMLAMTEGMTGTLYVAVMIARLVAMYSSNPPGEAAQLPLSSDHKTSTTLDQPTKTKTSGLALLL